MIKCMLHFSSLKRVRTLLDTETILLLYSPNDHERHFPNYSEKVFQ